jgi:sporulation protein YlmC with PRC-barrel domain
MIRSAAAATVALLALTAPGMAQTAPPTQESPDQWRASKLVGVAIYGPDNTSIGKISDLLMGKDGRIQTVVVGIGGILGIGEKDVAIPFDQVRFSDQPVTPPTPKAPVMQKNTAANGSPAGGTVPAPDDPGSGAASSTQPAATDVLGAPSHSAAYPEHGTIAMTLAQLKDAPAFHYAP